MILYTTLKDKWYRHIYTTFKDSCSCSYIRESAVLGTAWVDIFVFNSFSIYCCFYFMIIFLLLFFYIDLIVHFVPCFIYLYRIVRITSPWCIISPPPSSAQSSFIGKARLYNMVICIISPWCIISTPPVQREDRPWAYNTATYNALQLI